MFQTTNFIVYRLVRLVSNMLTSAMLNDLDGFGKTGEKKKLRLHDV